MKKKTHTHTQIKPSRNNFVFVFCFLTPPTTSILMHFIQFDFKISKRMGINIDLIFHSVFLISLQVAPNIFALICLVFIKNASMLTHHLTIHFFLIFTFFFSLRLCSSCIWNTLSPSTLIQIAEKALSLFTSRWRSHTQYFSFYK